MTCVEQRHFLHESFERTAMPLLPNIRRYDWRRVFFVIFQFNLFFCLHWRTVYFRESAHGTRSEHTPDKVKRNECFAGHIIRPRSALKPKLKLAKLDELRSFWKIKWSMWTWHLADSVSVCHLTPATIAHTLARLAFVLILDRKNYETKWEMNASGWMFGANVSGLSRASGMVLVFVESRYRCVRCQRAHTHARNIEPRLSGEFDRIWEIEKL